MTNILDKHFYQMVQVLQDLDQKILIKTKKLNFNKKKYLKKNQKIQKNSFKINIYHYYQKVIFYLINLQCIKQNNQTLNKTNINIFTTKQKGHNNRINYIVYNLNLNNKKNKRIM